MTLNQWINENYPTADNRLKSILQYIWEESRKELIKEQWELKSLNTKNGMQNSKKISGRPPISNRKKVQAKVFYKNNKNWKEICQRLNIGRSSFYKIVKGEL